MASAADLNRAGPPFVLTLEMDGEAFAAFDGLRRRFYAPERNLVPAHVTLFHKLPGEHARELKTYLREVAASARTIDVAVGEAKALEHGVAVFLSSPQLHSLRGELAAEWRPWLEERDRLPFRPHVTIQTTASEAEARRTIGAIRGSLPRQMRGTGLHLWRYRDGPWESAELFRFR